MEPWGAGDRPHYSAGSTGRLQWTQWPRWWWQKECQIARWRSFGTRWRRRCGDCHAAWRHRRLSRRRSPIGWYNPVYWGKCIGTLPQSIKIKLEKVIYICFVVQNLLGVSWPSGLAYRTQVLVLAAECGFESRPWHLCPWARHLTIIASLHPGVKWVPVRAELVD